jgi:hypothetical protein
MSLYPAETYLNIVENDDDHQSSNSVLPLPFTGFFQMNQ